MVLENITSSISHYSLQTLIALYFLSNSLRVFSYIAQHKQVATQNDDVRALSLLTWSIWALSNKTTALYSMFVLEKPDYLLAGLNFANTAGCMAVILIVISKRKAYAVKNSMAEKNEPILNFTQK